MKPKMKCKLLVDLLMSICLLLLMAYQIVGDVLHEWFGAGMLVLLLVHSLLNWSWYARLFRGRYAPLRIAATAVNFAVLAAILCLGYSGIVMSRYLFAFLPIRSGMALARVMHLAASYWGFVLMSLHLGLHWGMVTAMLRRLLRVKKSRRAARWAARGAVLAISAYGAYAFHAEKIADNLFLRTQFVFFDFEASAASVFGKYLAMMTLFAALAYYAALLLQKLRKKEEKAV